MITGPSGEPLTRFWALYTNGDNEEIFADNREDAIFRANMLGNATERTLEDLHEAIV